MFEAIIFDFDGVILNSEPLHYEAVTHVLKKFSIILSFEEYTKKYIGLSDKEMFPMLIQDKGLPLPINSINSLINEKVATYTNIINDKNNLPIINGVESYICNAVQDDKKIAICTGSTKKEISTALNKLKLHQHFDTIVSAEDVQFGKPSPEGYLLTAKRLGVQTNKCLVIEDSPHGISAAKNAGMHVIALTTTHASQWLQNADQIVADFEALLDITSRI